MLMFIWLVAWGLAQANPQWGISNGVLVIAAVIAFGFDQLHDDLRDLRESLKVRTRLVGRVKE